MTEMYPKTFTFDPVTLARARLVTLQNPNLDVLLDENRAEMPGIAHFLEGGFKARDMEGKLLLPDLSALSNRTIGVFSDYSGESGGRYITYSFVVCAFGSLDPFKLQMKALREGSGIGEKEIAFKDLGFKPLQRMVPNYLSLIDNYISGLVFTLVVDRSIPSLFGPASPEQKQKMMGALEQNGIVGLKHRVAEKLFRVVHVTSLLIALLGHEDQRIFWLTDNDAIAATQERHGQLMQILSLVLPLYTKKKFGLLGGALPFKPRAFEYLDILSIADLSAGAVAQCLDGIDTVGPENAQIKEGADHILRWLCHDSITLKKFCMIVRKDANGEVVSGPINFEARSPRENEIFIPMHLVRGKK